MSQANNFITKNDLMFFQNEVFIDLKNIETMMSSKMTKITENLENISKEYNQKFSDFSNKIKELVELISVINIDHDKVEELYKNKDRIKDELTESKARFNQYKKQIDSSLYKYDRIIIDNLEVPGLIGYNCKFNNLKQFLVFANGELTNLKLSKNQQEGEMKIIKEKYDKFSQKLDISNKDMIQRIDLIYTNKLDTFKREIEKRIEVNREIRAKEDSNKNFDFSKIEVEIKKHFEKSQENVKYEINDIFDKLKNNKETIDSNHIIINKQKEDFNILREQFDKLCEDVENLKIQNVLSNEKKINKKNLMMPINKNQKLNDDKIKENIKKKNNKILPTDLFNKYNTNKDNNKDYNKDDNKGEDKNRNKNILNYNKLNIFNEDINYKISKEKKENIESNNVQKKNNNIKENNIKSQSLSKNKKMRRSSLCIDIKNNNKEFLINDKDIENKDENSKIKRKISKKMLTYCQKTSLKLGKNILEKNFQKNILDFSFDSQSSSNEKENKKQDNQMNKFKKGKMNNDFINEQININLSKNLEINKKINKNVSKLIKLKPIEKPIKLNLINIKENNNINQINSTRNINKINNNLERKTKNVNFTINTFNKCKIENKNNNYINMIENTNNNEISSGKRNLNLTDKEILEKYINSIKNNQNKINSISKAIHIKNYKNAFTSPNLLEAKQKNNDNLGFNNSQKYSEEDFFGNNESNFCITSPFITAKNYSLYKTTGNFYKKSNNEQNPLNGFLTSIPIESKNKNEQEEDEKIIIINNKIKKINYKLKKINSNTKIIINRLNLLEVNYKPINSQINDILMIILIIYDHIKKRNTNNKLWHNLFNNSNIKKHFNKRFRGNNSLFSLNKTKNFLYTTNEFNLEEGGQFSNGLTKEELNIILKKIEPFLIKQFKDTI